MLENVHWLGHDSFRFDGSRTVYVDPWKLPGGAPAADVVLVTHDHYDHFSPPDVAAVAGPDTVVVGPPAVTGQVLDLRTVTLRPGETVTVDGLTITGVAAYNIDKFRAPGQPFHPREAGYLGFVFDLDGRRYYHAGDTDAVPEMAAVSCDVAFLPVGGTYTMTADEAAEACRRLQAAMVVPMHWGDIVGGRADAERFAAACPLPVTILEPEKR